MCINVGEGFELECVAAGVFKEHRVLLAGQTFEPHTGFNYELIDKRPDTIGKLFPGFDFQDDAEMRDRDGVRIDRVMQIDDPALGAQSGVEVRHQLVAKKVEVDPASIAPAFGQTHLHTIEITGFGDVTDLDGQVKGSEQLESRW